MELEVQTLVSHLREAEGGSAKDAWRMPDYVFTHIFWPLLCDKEVLFEKLDFSRFNYDDLTLLAERVEESWQSQSTLRGIADTLLQASPVSRTSRAFC